MLTEKSHQLSSAPGFHFLGTMLIAALLMVCHGIGQDDPEPVADPSFLRITPLEGVARTMTLNRINVEQENEDGSVTRVVRDVPEFPHWAFEPAEGAEHTRWRVEYKICICKTRAGRELLNGASSERVRTVNDEGFSTREVTPARIRLHPQRPQFVELEATGLPCRTHDDCPGTWYCVSGSWEENLANQRGLRLSVRMALGQGEARKVVSAKIRQGAEGGDAGGPWQVVQKE